MAEDDDGQRWELTVRGLKRWRRLQFPGTVAAVAGVDSRQGGWGCSRCAPCEEKGGTGEIFWPGGSRCLFNSAIVWSSGGGMEAVPRSGTWGGDPTQRG
jgi:hypothetical protein